MSQPCVLKHAAEITIFAMLKHRKTGRYVGHEKFEQLSKNALVFICKGDQPLPSVATLRNHFIEEIDIGWLRDTELEVVSTVAHVQLNQEPR